MGKESSFQNKQQSCVSGTNFLNDAIICIKHVFDDLDINYVPDFVYNRYR